MGYFVERKQGTDVFGKPLAAVVCTEFGGIELFADDVVMRRGKQRQGIGMFGKGFIIGVFAVAVLPEFEIGVLSA